MSGICSICGQSFNGRSDKKFCSDVCRIHSNNLKRSKKSFHSQFVLNELKKNERIIKEKIDKDIFQSDYFKLIAKGFNFNYFTQIFKQKNGIEILFCFDYGYYYSSNRTITFIKFIDTKKV